MPSSSLGHQPPGPGVSLGMALRAWEGLLARPFGRPAAHTLLPLQLCHSGEGAPTLEAEAAFPPGSSRAGRQSQAGRLLGHRLVPLYN